MMRRGQGEILDEALDGIERALTGDAAGGDPASRARDSKWWGWGDAGDTPELDARARWRCCASGSASCEPLTPRRAELEDFELPRAEPLPAALVEAVGAASASSPAHEDRIRHAAGSGYADLARLRAGRLEAAPDAVVLPADADAVRRGARGLRRRGHRRRPLRRRHQRRRRGRAAARRRTSA